MNTFEHAVDAKSALRSRSGSLSFVNVEHFVSPIKLAFMKARGKTRFSHSPFVWRRIALPVLGVALLKFCEI